MVVYAKSYPEKEPETLRAHTQALLERLEVIRKLSGKIIVERIPEMYRQYFWDALEVCCKGHDLGKVHSHFQNKILKRLGEESLKRLGKELIPVDDNLDEIPHNLLSCAFIHDMVTDFPSSIRHAIYQAIAFHHSRGSDEYSLSDANWRKVIEVINRDLKPRLHELADMQDICGNNIGEPKANFRREHLTVGLKGEDSVFYLFLKGLLHRLDHSASSHLEIELVPFGGVPTKIINYLTSRKGVKESKIWQRDLALRNTNKNIVMQAGTGTGKTEFALLWLNNKKAFYTLPVRTSVNAMYDRLKETFETEDIGLLHGESYFYALEGLLAKSKTEDIDLESFDLSIKQIDLARQLSMPISVSTADQLFTAVFRYKGYEKIYATLAYSGVVVDEIQSYDPDMVAVILKGLKDITSLGGHFCLITATLPKLYLDYIVESIPNVQILPSYYRKFKRHRIKILNHSILHQRTIKLIRKLYEEHKAVLIIVNTIKRAQELYNVLRGQHVYLLHAGFLYKDRREKESGENGIINKQANIWITTQLAEVSLDIDFPVMVTELSTIDSQIQRWGRIRRHSTIDYSYSKPNVYICSDASGIGSIYDSELVELTLHALERKENKLLSESDELSIINKVFSDVKQTQYYQRFMISRKFIEDLDYRVDTKAEAQDLFRKIINITAIPQKVFDDNSNTIQEALVKLSDKESKRFERLKALYEIKLYTVSIPYYLLKKTGYSIIREGLVVANIDYSEKLGIRKETEDTSIVF